MGRVSFQSPETPLNASAGDVFSFLSNLDNMEKLMPDQVINWRSDIVSCSFDIKGMAHINLLLGELTKNKKVTILSGPDNPIDLQILYEITETAGDSCTAVVTLTAELSMMLQMLASTPLQNLVNIMAEKLKKVFP